MLYRIVFSSDLHGNVKQYNKLFDYAVQEKCASIVIGGDITPKNVPEDSLIETQREFIEHAFLPLFERFHKEHPEITVYFIPGNDDCKVNMTLFNKNDSLVNVSMRCEYIDGEYAICGYPYVPVSLFQLKDWQKFDMYDIDPLSADLKVAYSMSGQERYKEGFLSSFDENGKGIFIPFMFNEIMRTNTEMYIQHDMKKIARKTNPSKTIYVIHCPPYGTSLDMAVSGQHVGSFAIRSFIETEQPYLTLHGHAHNTVELSGKFMEKIGTSISASSGNNWRSFSIKDGDEFNDKISLLIFDLYDPFKMERVTF